MPRLSAIVITKNEAHQIARCLGSVASLADEIVVVDSGSSDGTPDIARRLGARVIETTDWPGFGPQKQRALDAARGDWVLAIDADEWLGAQLAGRIAQAVAQPWDAASQPSGYELMRLSAFCGQWIRGGDWYPDPGLRLVRRDRARFTPDLVHEHLEVDGRTERLAGLLLHDSIPTLESGLDKANRYSTGRAADLAARGRRGGLGSAIAHGLWAFVRTYLLRGGFKDGRLGVALALLNAETTYYRYLKLWLQERTKETLVPPPDA